MCDGTHLLTSFFTQEEYYGSYLHLIDSNGYANSLKRKATEFDGNALKNPVVLEPSWQSASFNPTRSVADVINRKRNPSS
jgi:hypothetical protein